MWRIQRNLLVPRGKEVKKEAEKESENQQCQKGYCKKQTKVTQDPEESNILKAKALEMFKKELFTSDVTEKELEPSGK